MKLLDNIYMTRFPNNNKDYYSNLSEKEKELYRRLVEGYYYCLYIFINNRIGLSQFDDMLASSDNKYDVINEKEKDMYQLLSPYKYMYIRNNVYLERLSPDELNFLSKMIDENIDYNAEIDSFVSKTYKKVISEFDGLKTKINFGPDSSSYYYCDSESLIIGYRVNDVNLNNKQIDELNFASSFFKVKSENIIDIPINYILYNSMSIKKIDDDITQVK